MSRYVSDHISAKMSRSLPQSMCNRVRQLRMNCTLYVFFIIINTICCVKCAPDVTLTSILCSRAEMMGINCELHVVYQQVLLSNVHCCQMSHSDNVQQSWDDGNKLWTTGTCCLSTSLDVKWVPATICSKCKFKIKTCQSTNDTLHLYVLM